MTEKVTPLTGQRKLSQIGKAIIKQGYPVFICGGKSNGKAPLDASIGRQQIVDAIDGLSQEALEGKSGCYLYTYDPASVDRLSRLPGAQMWGVPCGEPSGLYVIDVDLYGEKKDDAVRWLKASQSWLKGTRSHTTMSGGLHYLFAHDGELGNVDIADGIDSRGTGGYIIFAGNPGYKVKRRAKVQMLPMQFWEQLKERKKEDDNLTVAQRLAVIAAGGNCHANVLSITAHVAATGGDMNDAQLHIIAALKLAVIKNKRPQDRLEQLLAKELDDAVASALSKYEKPDADAGMDDVSDQLAELMAPPDPLSDGAADEDLAAPASHHWAHDMPDEAMDADIIEDMIDRSGVTVVYGEPGAGKSFILLDMAAAVARGSSWFGRYTRKGKVLYCAAEGARGFRNRARAYMKHHGIDELDIVIYDGPVNLAQQSIMKNADLLAALQEARWSMIVFDTLQATTAGVSLNDAEIWGDVMTNVRALTRTYGCNVAFAHHANKGQGDVYGSVFIKAGADHIFKVEGSDGVHTLAAIKQKDYETHGQFWAFGLETVELGVQRVRPDGSTSSVSSAVVVAARNTQMTQDDLGEMVGSAVVLEVVKSNVERHEAKQGRYTLEYVLKTDVINTVLFKKMVLEFYGKEYEDLHSRQRPEVWKSLKDHQYLEPELGKGGKRIWLLEGWDVQ